MVRVNLLPWRQQQRQREQRVFAAQLAASFAAAVLLTAALGFHLDTQIDRQERRNRSLTEQMAALDGDIAQIDVVRRRQEDIDHRTQVLARLWHERSTSVDIFNELARTMVVGAHYTALTRRGDILAAQGAAASNDRVSSLMRNLDDSDRFATPNLQSISAQASADYGHDAAIFALRFVVDTPDENP